MLETNCCYNMDCLAGMKQFPDGYFDLAVVDPPYCGGGMRSAGRTERGLAGDSRDTCKPNRRDMGGEVR